MRPFLTLAFLLAIMSPAFSGDYLHHVAVLCKKPPIAVAQESARTFARHGFRVTYANADLGTVTGEQSGKKDGSYYTVTLTVSTDTDSLHILSTASTTDEPRVMFFKDYSDDIAPIVSDLTAWAKQ